MASDANSLAKVSNEGPLPPAPFGPFASFGGYTLIVPSSSSVERSNVLSAGDFRKTTQFRGVPRSITAPLGDLNRRKRGMWVYGKIQFCRKEKSRCNQA